MAAVGVALRLNIHRPQISRCQSELCMCACVCVCVHVWVGVHLAERSWWKAVWIWTGAADSGIKQMHCVILTVSVSGRKCSWSATGGAAIVAACFKLSHHNVLPSLLFRCACKVTTRALCVCVCVSDCQQQWRQVHITHHRGSRDVLMSADWPCPLSSTWKPCVHSGKYSSHFFWRPSCEDMYCKRSMTHMHTLHEETPWGHGLSAAKSCPADDDHRMLNRPLVENFCKKKREKGWTVAHPTGWTNRFCWENLQLQHPFVISCYINHNAAPFDWDVACTDGVWSTPTDHPSACRVYYRMSACVDVACAAMWMETAYTLHSIKMAFYNKKRLFCLY